MKSFNAYLDRSSSVWLGSVSIVVLGLLASCEPAKAFQCTNDEECVLGSQQGICVSTSRCAYPNDACASGYAYPEGAGENLAGVCLPPGIVEGATEGANAAVDTDTEGGPSTSSGGGSQGG